MDVLIHFKRAVNTPLRLNSEFGFLLLALPNHGLALLEDMGTAKGVSAQIGLKCHLEELFCDARFTRITDLPFREVKRGDQDLELAPQCFFLVYHWRTIRRREFVRCREQHVSPVIVVLADGFELSHASVPNGIAQLPARCERSRSEKGGQKKVTGNLTPCPLPLSITENELPCNFEKRAAIGLRLDPNHTCVRFTIRCMELLRERGVRLADRLLNVVAPTVTVGVDFLVLKLGVSRFEIILRRIEFDLSSHGYVAPLELGTGHERQENRRPAIVFPEAVAVFERLRDILWRLPRRHFRHVESRVLGANGHAKSHRRKQL